LSRATSVFVVVVVVSSKVSVDVDVVAVKVNRFVGPQPTEDREPVRMPSTEPSLAVAVAVICI
jgi:hypothetical protein